MAFEETFKVCGVDYEVEWEMEGAIAVWNLKGDDTCNAPNVEASIRDMIDYEISVYMEDWYRGMDDYS